MKYKIYMNQNQCESSKSDSQFSTNSVNESIQNNDYDWNIEGIFPKYLQC